MSATSQPRDIPTVEDFTSDVVIDRFDDMVNPPGLTNHLATAQVDHDVVAVRSLNVPPVSQGDCITGQLYLGGRLARSFGEPVSVVWRPDRVLRSTEMDGWRVETVTVCPVGEPAVLVDISVTNLGNGARDLTIGLAVASTVVQSAKPWLGAEPPTAPNTLEADGDYRIGCPADGSAFSAQTLCLGGGDWQPVAGSPRMLQTSATVPAGGTVTLAYVHAIAAKRDDAISACERVTTNVPGAVTACEESWNRSLRNIFTPGNDEFGGCLPRLITSSDALRTLYWWGAMGVLWFRRDNPASVLGRTYDTLMPRYWQTTTFIWDYSLSAQVHALLDPEVMRKQITHWVGLDIDRHFGTEWLTGGPVGYWYSVNHYAMTRLVHEYLRMSGDTAFLDHSVSAVDGASRPMAEHVIGWARAWHRIRSDSGMADYGEIDNLLECVSTYTHEVASLNAANVWCMRTSATIADSLGRPDEAAALRAEADDLVKLVAQRYIPGSGYFHTRRPDGTLVPTRHCYDFATVGTTIAEDLPEDCRSEMVRFFTDELQTPSWMRALSPFDEDAAFSLRADHQWNGAYPAWPADSARAAIALGQPQVAVDWLEGLARSTNQGPPGQAHFVEEAAETVNGGARKTPPQFPYLIDWSCSSAGAWCELVLSGVFGLEVALDGTVTVGGCLDLVDPQAELRGLVVHGRSRDVVGGQVIE